MDEYRKIVEETVRQYFERAKFNMEKDVKKIVSVNPIIPSKIHFAGFDFEVEEVEQLDGEVSWGRTMFASGKIFIEKRLSPQKKLETLIHELLHIAYSHTGHKMDDGDKAREEELLRAWSKNIYGILAENGFLAIPKT